jgi:hypothetical protein
MKKNLYIINGVSGSIGNALLALIARNSENVVYGLSRKAIGFHKFGKVLPEYTLVTSIGENIADDFIIGNFIKSCDIHRYKTVTYIHAVGLYPFEINGTENDLDNDGVNDDCLRLTYTAFSLVCNTINNEKHKNFAAVIFGSISDRYHLSVHHSWWKTIEKTKQYMKNIASDNISMNIINISSVVCFHELLTRPFVFIKTNAVPEPWLTPFEVAQKTLDVLKEKNKYCEVDYFHHAQYHNSEYFSEEKFTQRKIDETYVG